MTDKKETKEEMIVRPPVVAVMGHIDHGKSTLLDYLRKSKIVDGEAGGITQHIGAYEVNRNEKKITFLDTPGHEAFMSVRERGAQIADIAILILSAEDGVKPQTLEALRMIKESNIPFIVAINKIDSPKANLDLAKASLIENEVYLEGMGGDISFAEISAKEGTGVDDLLDLVLLTAEVEDFKAEPNGKVTGFVVESHKCKKKGVSATLILKNGTLKKGSFIATNSAFSPVRLIEDQDGKSLDEVSFSTPFEICGFSSMPQSGDSFEAFEKKKEAEAFAGGKRQESGFRNQSSEIKDGETVIPLIIKADVVGSKEAIEYELSKLELEGIQFKILESSTGDVSEKDTKLAITNNKTLIVGFNVDVGPQAKQMIEREKIAVKIFDIIYEATQWIEEQAKERKEKIVIEEEIGKAKVLKIFGNDKKLQVIGAKVKEGKLEKGSQFKLLRRMEEIDKGKIKGLQKVREEVSLVTEGEEFGSAIDCKTELAEGDMIYAYQTIEK
jgi:translation initiation factor IF-2